MRTAQMNAQAPAGGGYQELKRGSAAGERTRRGRRGNGRAPRGSGPGRGSRLPGLRWVPVPLAVLAAVLGWLVLGSLQGQAAANLAANPDQAGGLALSVDTMAWMSNDMTGQGPLKRAPQNFSMPSSMMPGMQSGNDDRLRVEVDLRNVTNDVQHYSIADFSVVAPGGHRWQVNYNGRSDSPASAYLQPGFGVTTDLYFDIPITKSKHLTLEWSRGGRTVSIPVNTNGSNPGRMTM